MAGASLLAVIDDITSVLDDIASMTKLAAKKTSGVLGDDIALGAQQSQHKVADRELPIVWAIFKGSLVNKAILVPIAILVSVFLPQAIIWALIVGGVYLCLEGFEKVHEHFSASHPEDAIKDDRTESEKVKGAIKTDMVLSLEVIVLTLGMVATAPLMTKIGVLSAIGVAMSVFVYSLIALIIRMDDRGLSMVQHSETGSIKNKIGMSLVSSAPRIMQIIGVVGTIAMFSVGGSIMLHVGHIEFDTLVQVVGLDLNMINNIWGLNGLGSFSIQMITGLFIGGLAFLGAEAIHLVKDIYSKKAAA